MVFSQSTVQVGTIGDLEYAIYEFNSAGVTSGTITTKLKTIKHVSFTNRTEQRGTIAITAGAVALSNLTSGDVGSVMVVGY